MINKISSSKQDKINLSSVRKNIIREKIIKDYKKRVVNKPWGYEYLMLENQHVAVWILFLKKGCSTSMHCHPKKKTSLVVLSGQVITSSLESHFDLKELDACKIDAGVFHATKAVSAKGALVMEIETPPDKSDLIRLKDSYGREGKGYEGRDYTSTELSEYEYLDFHDAILDKNMNKYIHKNFKNRHIRIQHNSHIDDLLYYLNQCEEAVICFLDTDLINDTSVVSEIGGIITKSDLKSLNSKKLRVNADSITLIIH